MELMINQDIRKYKAKDIGMFSFKEAGFLALAVGLGGAVYYVEKYVMHQAFELSDCIPFMIVPLLFGFGKFQGMSTWQFIKTVVTEKFLTQKMYVYESDFEVEPDKFGELYGEDYKVDIEKYIEKIEKIEKEHPDKILKGKEKKEYESHIVFKA